MDKRRKLARLRVVKNLLYVLIVMLTVSCCTEGVNMLNLALLGVSGLAFALLTLRIRKVQKRLYY